MAKISIKDLGPRPNTTQTSLPTSPDQHNDQGSFKIDMPYGSKYSPTKNT
jgi:hypothetical protein